MNSQIDLLFLGLPDTGKTTYLLALDEVLETEQHGLVSNGFGANRAYLEGAKVMWRAADPITRTNLKPINEPIELLVRHPETSGIAKLLAPDVYGEFYDDQWADRKMPIVYRDRLATLSGLLVFINGGKLGGMREMTEIWKKVSKPKVPARQWEARLSPEQLKLVDLLQLIIEYGKPRTPLPTAVMISAWDLVTPRYAPKITPEQYLHNDWSLLKQFFDSNPESFRTRLFGVSARGGRNEDKEVLVKQHPHERIWLQDGEKVTDDLTIPIRWLLNWP